MIYKSCIGDYPLLDYPCKHWWVRYGVACTLLKTQFEKLWSVKLRELEKKYNFTGISYKGIFNLKNVRDNPVDYVEAEIFVYHNKRQIKITNVFSELHQVLREYLTQKEDVYWQNCPYERDHQSKCPFYEKEEFYAKTPLEELRQRKGYEL